jgi:hypothetical protein
MVKLDTPAMADLPTTRQLNRATLFAAAAAAVILVTTVLPAEYGVDPTGIGGVMGLTEMGLTKQGVATGGVPTDEAPVTTQLPDGSTQIQLILRPYNGKEAKATMQAGEEFTYRWTTDGVPVEFEFHGDPKGGDGKEFSSYEKGEAASGEGKFRAPFEGRHGWYWKNNTNKPILITASVNGKFEKFAVLD